MVLQVRYFTYIYVQRKLALISFIFLCMIILLRTCSIAKDGRISGSRMKTLAHFNSSVKARIEWRFSGLVRGISSWKALHVHIIMVLRHIEKMSHVPRTLLPDTQLGPMSGVSRVNGMAIRVGGGCGYTFDLKQYVYLLLNDEEMLLRY